jgi:hypothetical protein
MAKTAYSPGQIIKRVLVRGLKPVYKSESLLFYHIGKATGFRILGAEPADPALNLTVVDFGIVADV